MGESSSGTSRALKIVSETHQAMLCVSDNTLHTCDLLSHCQESYRLTCSRPVTAWRRRRRRWLLYVTADGVSTIGERACNQMKHVIFGRCEYAKLIRRCLHGNRFRDSLFQVLVPSAQVAKVDLFASWVLFPHGYVTSVAFRVQHEQT